MAPDADQLFAKANNHGEILALTGLRGFAAVWVFVYHFWALEVSAPVVLTIGCWQLDITKLFNSGGSGVQIFFVLSGFLLAQPFVQAYATPQRQRIPLVPYFIRRIARVFPAYYLQLAVLVCASSWWQFGPAPYSVTSWLVHLTMSFYMPPLFQDAILGVWWTLPIEFSFYLLLPLLAVFLKQNRGIWLLLFCLISMASYRWLAVAAYADTGVPMHLRIHLLPGSLDSFGLGAFAAYCSVHHRRCINLLRPYWGLLGFALVIVAVSLMGQFWRSYWSGHWLLYMFTPLLSAGTIAMIFAVLSGSRWVDWLFGNRLMHAIGTISYSFYLWHLAVLVGIKHWPYYFAEMSKVSLFVSCSVLTLLLSIASYLLAEKPGIALGRRLANALRGPPLAASS
jgi:peptidoglycan/LPS O-acetylase OafA/YrhL